MVSNRTSATTLDRALSAGLWRLGQPVPKVESGRRRDVEYVGRSTGASGYTRARPTSRGIWHAYGTLARMGQVVRIVVLAAVVTSMALVPACGFDALPTDDTGTGNTEELEEALSLHDLQLPADASDISYTVHTSIDSHAVGLRLRTTTAGLDGLLISLDSSQRVLEHEMNPWAVSSRLSSHSPERFGWDLASITNYAGVEVESGSSLRSTGVLVDLDEPDVPVVYIEALNCC
jgi:hypothetical protein